MFTRQSVKCVSVIRPECVKRSSSAFSKRWNAAERSGSKNSAHHASCPRQLGQQERFLKLRTASFPTLQRALVMAATDVLRSFLPRLSCQAPCLRRSGVILAARSKQFPPPKLLL